MIYTAPPLRMSRLRFELRPRTALTLAPERRAEVLYGALGTILRRTACDPGCPGADSCTHRHDCAYAQIFEPAAPPDARFGAKEARKAFLFRPPLDTDPLFGPLRPLIFELRLFGEAIHASALFIDAFRRLGDSGLADRAVDLVSVLSLDWKGTSAHILFEEGRITHMVVGLKRWIGGPAHQADMTPTTSTITGTPSTSPGMSRGVSSRTFTFTP